MSWSGTSPRSSALGKSKLASTPTTRHAASSPLALPPLALASGLLVRMGWAWQVLYARHDDQRSATFRKVLSMGEDYMRDTKALLLRINLMRHDFILKARSHCLPGPLFPPRLPHLPHGRKGEGERVGERLLSPHAAMHRLTRLPILPLSPHKHPPRPRGSRATPTLLGPPSRADRTVKTMRLSLRTCRCELTSASLSRSTR